MHLCPPYTDSVDPKHRRHDITTLCSETNIPSSVLGAADMNELVWFFQSPAPIWASLMAQMVKNPPAMQETWVRSLGREDSLEEGMVTHSSILAWRIPMDKRAWLATVHGVAKSGTWLNDWAQQSTASIYLLMHGSHPSNHALSGLKTHSWPAECGHLWSHWDLLERTMTPLCTAVFS